MLGIVIIAYNVPEFIVKQCELIKRFCKDEYKIIVIDNSSLAHESKSIKYHSERLNCWYMRTQASSTYGSESHAFAANISYQTFKNDYSHFLYLDHDCFPLKEFSVKATLSGKIIAGIAQQKEKLYLWPGCLMIDNSNIIKGLVDFSVDSENKLDTGGKLYKIIEHFGKSDCLFFNESHIQNRNFNKSFYNFYSLINNSQFMHFINGSNWNNSNDNQERINSLFNELEALTS